ncbi:hypothetical protein ACGTN6_06165 [Halomonas sp. THAF12]|uniref:hypothetical protein n=1 Tax=Halomonas sp. B23F22_10 TaxID=3459515 RepID=UPI00373E8A86
MHRCLTATCLTLLILAPAMAGAEDHRHGPVLFGTAAGHQHGPVHYGNGPDYRQAPGLYRTHPDAESPYLVPHPSRPTSPVIIVEPRIYLDRHEHRGFSRSDHWRTRHRERFHRDDPPWFDKHRWPPRDPRTTP